MKTKVKRSFQVSWAAAAGVFLAGCSATHVGEAWQCPLAQGTSCTTIAEADPAVPAGTARTAALFGEPLPRDDRRGDEGPAGGWHVEGVTCNGRCGFFAWLQALFGAEPDDHAARLSVEAPATTATTESGTGQDAAGASAAPGSAVAADASLRVPEVLGRIWIAPFVDADGIYREAHWVRVVLEPAGWKLP